jgi:hypothetical protein
VLFLSSKINGPMVFAVGVSMLLDLSGACLADDSFQPAPPSAQAVQPLPPQNVQPAPPPQNVQPAPVPLPAIQPAENQTTAPVLKTVLSERTPVRLVLDQALKSGSCKVGDLVEYHVENDIYTTDRQLVVLAGSRAYGRVLTSKRHSYVGIPGKLTIGVAYILTPDKTKIPLSAVQPGGKGHSEFGGTIAATVIVGLPGLLISGEDKSLPKGTEVAAYVAADTPLIPYTTLIGEHVPPFDPLGPIESLYKLNDGTQVIGVQNAFDGSKYSVMTDSGLQLINISDVRAIYHVAGPEPPKANEVKASK